MNLVEENEENILSTVFATTIREDRLITIPVEIRDYFKVHYKINLENGVLIEVKIKNINNKESNYFPKEVTAKNSIRIPTEIIQFYGFELNEPVEVEIKVNKNKVKS